MFNKNLIVYNQAPGAGYRFVDDLESFRGIAGQNGDPVIFGDRLLKVKRAQWRRFVDIFLYHQAVTQPEGPDRAGPVVDFVDQSVHADYDIDKLVTETSNREFQSPKHSFVIPFRDRDDTLPLVLDAMKRIQGGGEFEVLLVNDGSREPVATSVRQALNELGRRWTLIHLPPSKLFRAGFARNVGASYATGDNLVFIDSDILLPKDFFTDLEMQFQSGEVIQARRWQIWSDARPTLGETFSGELEEPNPFWREFQTSDIPWMQSEQPWRWASTFCLAVSRKMFLELGGFRLWYSTYGFEDTDFGLRAHRAGLRLKRSNADVFHLNPSTRDAVKNEPRKLREDRLKLSARKYFLCNQAMESLPWLTHMMV